MSEASLTGNDSLTYWRVNVLFAILFAALVACTFAMFAAITLVIKEEVWGLAIFDVLCYAICIALLISRRPRYEVRATIGVLLFYGVGLVVIISVGPLSGGPIWLFTFAVLAGVLLGSKAAIAAIALNASTLTILAWLLSAGRFGQGFPFFNTPQALVTAFANFLALNIVAVMAVSALVKGVVYSHGKERALTSNLEREQKRLIEAKQRLEIEVVERKQAEEALRESEQQYRSILENIEDVYFRADMDGNLLFLSPSGLRMFGYDRMEEAMKVNLAGDICDDPKERDLFLKTLMKKGSAKNQELTLRKKDGTLLRSETNARVVCSQSGKVIGVEGILRDITDRKRSEEERKGLEARLQRAQKMEAIGTLAGGVAHDLNNVLCGIVSYPDLLRAQLPEDSPLREPLMIIQESGKKAAAIVEDLLTLARRGVATTEVVNLNSLISSYLKSPEYEELRTFHPEVLAVPDLSTDLLNIMGSPIHLSKTIMNLVSNAAEAMPDGGKIIISSENRYAHRPISAYDGVEEGDHVVITVSDTGVGIPQEDRERIFEPFYTKKVMGRSGTGLGMAVVWGTVMDHRGYIDVKSKEGEGSEFTLFFPATRKALAEVKPLLSNEAYKGNGESILVVDDVEEQKEIATTLLTQLGYSVTAVSSGEDAVEYMKNNEVDLIVLDMIMEPGVDGLDTYKEILKLHPGQKAVIASGFSETNRVKEAQKLGAGKYLRKPYTIEKIALALKEELAN